MTKLTKQKIELLIRSAVQWSRLDRAKGEEHIKNLITDILREVLGPERHTKPGHGICCTCQECGFHYDDCECDYNQFVKDKRAKAKELGFDVEV